MRHPAPLLIGGMNGRIRNDSFLASFGVFDLLWFFLAAGTAFRLGSNSSSSDE